MTTHAPLTVSCEDEAATAELAAAFASALPPKLVIGLIGTLGAGKTHFVREIVDALGGRAEDVVSPTFVLCQHYDTGSHRINHLDAYRIKDDDEFLELGVDELFDSDAVTFVEWSERVARCLPRLRLEIELKVTGKCSRQVVFRPFGDEIDRFVERLRGGRRESDGR